MIPIKTTNEIKIMAEGGKILAKIMKKLKSMVKPGITTNDLEKIAENLILQAGAKSSFKGYEGPSGEYIGKPYPSCLCTSVNEQIVHAIPSSRQLKEGDIISLDSGLFWGGYHVDMAITVPVGEISLEVQRLIWATKKALKRALKKVRPGNTFGDAANAIQKHIESQRFDINRDFGGHGIGKKLHEEPEVLNYGKRKTGPKFVEGMVFCFEPMASLGNTCLSGRISPLAGKTKKCPDGYGYQTADNSLSAHFEHTVAVTKNGCQVLTSF
jgi:methionyl aminopeptidase